jgi:hypothetical protein
MGFEKNANGKFPEKINKGSTNKTIRAKGEGSRIREIKSQLNLPALEDEKSPLLGKGGNIQDNSKATKKSGKGDSKCACCTIM